eukprot:Plantae.Rhodophyta-Hildenbrandia_rubra.ctg16801.p1 GENE.Plantae.Rhodophyta-Hildenbrandia_rubra.ctg16801~~Plantae.Rhodophyta-Hildenbrandia_rubra.ctg16801.p1  ORF type:complete len:585 (-),score=109.82 Plantae.Rhodophyta-Hildenbrandia_rubra.ctg16801:1579-3288(-)
MAGFVSPAPLFLSRQPLLSKLQRSSLRTRSCNNGRTKRVRRTEIFASADSDPSGVDAAIQHLQQKAAENGDEEVELPPEAKAAAMAAVNKEMPLIVSPGESGQNDGALESAVGSVPKMKEKEGPMWIDSVVGARGKTIARPEVDIWRQEAEQHLDGLPLPSRREEAWRFTDMRSLYGMRFAPVESDIPVDVTPFIPKEAGSSLVFVDGVFRKDLSVIGKELLHAGGYVGGLEGYTGSLEEIGEALECGETAEENGLYPALNKALARDVTVLRLPRNHVEAKPISFIFASTGAASREAAAVSAARLAIIAEPMSQATILEHFTGLGGEERPFFFSSACAGIVLKDGANLLHVAANETGTEGHHVAQVHATVKRDATYNYRTIFTSGSVGRTACGIDLDESGSHGSVNGLMLVDKKRVGDLHSRISHNAPNATSSQLQKNIASERGRAIFSGKILVKREAANTESSQLCNSLLLSNKARIDAMPVLEIANQDVQCSHGATVSDLDEEQMFYLRSRGISVNVGRALMMEGFALESVKDNPFSRVEEQVRAKVKDMAPSVAGRSLKNAQFSSI